MNTRELYTAVAASNRQGQLRLTALFLIGLTVGTTLLLLFLRN
jgi:hypothetical protein